MPGILQRTQVCSLYNSDETLHILEIKFQQKLSYY